MVLFTNSVTHDAGALFRDHVFEDDVDVGPAMAFLRDEVAREEARAAHAQPS